MVKPTDLSRAGERLAYDQTGTGKVARDVVIASTLGGGGASFVRRFPTFARKIGLQAYKHGVPAFVGYYGLKPIVPALRGDRKIGIRFGAEGVMPMGLLPAPIGMYVVPSLRRLPVPVFGFGFTAVPNDEPFFSVRSQSRGGEDATSTGTPRSTRTASNTIDGPLAHGRGYPDTSAEERPRPTGRETGRPLKGKRRRRWNSEAVTPYCWRHKRRHYCRYI